MCNSVYSMFILKEKGKVNWESKGKGEGEVENIGCPLKSIGW